MGASSQSVSVVNLIKAGGRRCSSREQVPLTVESGSTLGLAILLCHCTSCSLIPLCQHVQSLCILTAVSPCWRRPSASSVSVCLVIICRNGGLATHGTSTSNAASARLSCRMTFTDLQNPHKPSPPSCSLCHCFLCLSAPYSIHLSGSIQPN